VADDVASNLKLLTYYLESAGARVEAAEDGRIACDKVVSAQATANPFVAVLMDMEMPELDGYTAAARLRHAGYAGAIIAVTGRTTEADRTACLGAGCDTFIGKPIELESLIGMLLRHIEARSPKHAALSAPSPPAPCASMSPVADNPRFAALLEMFVAELPERAERLERSVERGDLVAVTSLAHQLQGAAASYGFGAISAAAASLEAMARTRQSLDQITPVVHRVADLCRRARSSQAEPATGPR
jgi:CheY-like chemotaxis protein/HPt (histidine-containing phosphotransfer) domain-containing protein